MNAPDEAESVFGMTPSSSVVVDLLNQEKIKGKVPDEVALVVLALACRQDLMLVRLTSIEAEFRRIRKSIGVTGPEFPSVDQTLQSQIEDAHRRLKDLENRLL